MKGHTEIVSRQCEGMSDPEGSLPKFATEEQYSATACDTGPKRGATQFDEPGPDIAHEGPMEEEHTSNTR